MKGAYRYLIVAAGVLPLFYAFPGMALEVDQQAFVTAYIDAIDTKDSAKQKALIYPASLACINNATKDFFDDYFARALKYTIPADAKVSFSSDATVAAFVPSGFTMPATPTEQITLEYKKSRNSNMTLIRMLAKQDGRLYEVVPCPTESGMALFHKNQAEGAEQKKQAQKRIDEMPAEWKAAIVNLLQKDDTGGAADYYKGKAGVDVTDAYVVIGLMQEQMGK